MSGAPIWAMMAPSWKPTIEWISDSGWMMTSTWSGVTPKNSRVSITSSALLNIEAESMVMRWPIAQLGCARASFTVAFAKASSGQSRRAPPEAVRMMRSTAPMSSPVSAWKIAECSLSTGRMVAPCAIASASKSGPAVTRLSLLASASVLPWRSARKPGTRPAAPTIALITQSAGRSAASAMASGPAAAATPDPASRSRSSARSEASAQTATSARNSRDISASRATLRPPVRATTRKAPAPPARWIRSTVCSPTDPVAPKIEMLRIRSAPAQAGAGR